MTPSLDAIGMVRPFRSSAKAASPEWETTPRSAWSKGSPSGGGTDPSRLAVATSSNPSCEVRMSRPRCELVIWTALPTRTLNTSFMSVPVTISASHTDE